MYWAATCACGSRSRPVSFQQRARTIRELPGRVSDRTDTVRACSRWRRVGCSWSECPVRARTSSCSWGSQIGSRTSWEQPHLADDKNRRHSASSWWLLSSPQVRLHTTSHRTTLWRGQHYNHQTETERLLEDLPMRNARCGWVKQTAQRLVSKQFRRLSKSSFWQDPKLPGKRGHLPLVVLLPLRSFLRQPRI